MKSTGTLLLGLVGLVLAPWSLAAKPVTIGIITNNPAPFWNYVEAGSQKAAKGATDVEVLVEMPKIPTIEQQHSLVRKMLTRGVDALVIAPIDPRNQREFLQDVNRKVPVIFVDNDLQGKQADLESVRRCFVGTDNVAMGKAAGRLLQTVRPKGGKFAVFVGLIEPPVARDRRRGLVAELAGGEAKCKEQLAQMNDESYPVTFGKFELVSTVTDNGQFSRCVRGAENVLIKEPHVSAMVGLWAYNAPALGTALQRAGVANRIKVIGFDEDPRTLESIRRGFVHGTVVQNPFEMGRRAVLIGAALANGDRKVFEKPEFSLDKQNRLLLPVRTITKKNVEAFQTKLKEMLSAEKR